MAIRSAGILAAVTRCAKFLSPLALCLPLSAASAPSFGRVAGAAPQFTTDVVGLLRVEAPSETSFLLHGTLPLPRRAWVNLSTEEPLVVLDHDGTVVPTQCEVVSRYPSELDGADVVEVLARVNRPASVAPGTPLAYRVVYYPHASPADPVASVPALYEGPTAVPQNVKNLLKDPYSFVIECIDPFGNSYLALPFDGKSKMELLRHGQMSAQARIAMTLVPTPFKSGSAGTLPHSLGVHAYVTVNSKSDLVGIDLRFHNAHDGRDKSDPLDDPLGKIYFREINLYVPNGWFLVQDFLDPFLSMPTATANGWSRFPLVSPTSQGMHAMQWQSQFHRRLMLAPESKVVQAQSVGRGAGLGFATRGVSPYTGKKLWSWWNKETARWYPQSQRLPSLDHVAPAALDTYLQKNHDYLESHLSAGTASGIYPVFAEVLGHAHPYGVKYGGMTGGVEIYLYDGIRTLERASLAGYRTMLMTHRMTTDRMPNALFGGDGEPTTVEDWVIPVAGGKDYVPLWFFGVPDTVTTDPFGLNQAPTFQVEYVESNGLQAPFTAELESFYPLDYQHLIRYTRVAKNLVWLANDSLAKDDLRMQTETFHFSYHPYYNTPYQHKQVTGLRYDMEDVAAHGPVGFTFGRGEAWALDCTLSTYATATPQWRSDNREWIDQIADVLFDGQAQCTGFIQASIGEKFWFSQYRARQIIEQSIIENAILGLIETVYRGQDSTRTSMMTDTLRRSLYSMLDPMSWEPGQSAPWGYAMVGPADTSLPPYCDISEVPASGHSPYVDAYQNWSSFAYGFQMTGDPVFLQFAQIQAGGDLVGAVLSDGDKNVENRAALLALIEEALGMP